MAVAEGKGLLCDLFGEGIASQRPHPPPIILTWGGAGTSTCDLGRTHSTTSVVGFPSRNCVKLLDSCLV